MSRDVVDMHVPVVTLTPDDIAEGISILESAIAIHRRPHPRNDTPSVARRNRAEVGATASCPDSRVVRRAAGDGGGATSSCSRVPDERNAERAADERRVAEAS